MKRLILPSIMIPLTLLCISCFDKGTGTDTAESLSSSVLIASSTPHIILSSTIPVSVSDTAPTILLSSSTTLLTSSNHKTTYPLSSSSKVLHDTTVLSSSAKTTPSSQSKTTSDSLSIPLPERSIEDVRNSVTPIDYTGALLYSSTDRQRMKWIGDSTISYDYTRQRCDTDSKSDPFVEDQVLAGTLNYRYNDSTLLFYNTECTIQVFDRISGTGLLGEWKRVNIAPGWGYDTNTYCQTHANNFELNKYNVPQVTWIITADSLITTGNYYQQCPMTNEFRFFTPEEFGCSVNIQSMNGHKRFDKRARVDNYTVQHSSHFMGSIQECHFEWGTEVTEEGCVELKTYEQCVATYYSELIKYEQYHINDDVPFVPDTRPETSSIGTNQVRDERDNQTYRVVTIGPQTWFAENLKYDNGTGSACFDNDSSLCDTYGRYYTWWNMMNRDVFGKTIPEYRPDVCPKGWHVPSDFEWLLLAQYIEGHHTLDSVALTDTYYDISHHLRAADGWVPYDTVTSIDTYGFSAYPTGRMFYYSNTFAAETEFSSWWSTTEKDASDKYARRIRFNANSFDGYATDKDMGLPIRCVEGDISYSLDSE
ncbi:MAG: hypothetical protein OCD01_05235 [Fibrobacterales bacterium]